MKISGRRSKWASRIFERAIQIREIENDDFRISATYFHYGSLRLLQFQASDRKDHTYLEHGQALLNRSLALQISQENFWMLDRTYENLAKCSELSGDLNKASDYLILSKEQKIERNIFISPRYH